MANIFKEAKKIQRMHKSWDWQKCIQMASKRHKPAKVGKVKRKKTAKKKSYRQTGTSDRSRDQMIKAKAPGKRAGYYERRKNRSDVPGTMSGVSTSTLKSVIKERLKDSLGKQLVRKELAKRKLDKRKIQKQIVSTRLELRRLL